MIEGVYTGEPIGMSPWEKSSNEIDLRETFRAEIVVEESKQFFVRFMDRDSEIVECRMDKTNFEGFPYLVTVGVFFVLVVYSIKNISGVIASPWPLPEYWNKSLSHQ